jgi:hypothetical protein
MSSVKTALCVVLMVVYAPLVHAESDVALYHVHVEESCGDALASDNLRSQIQVRLPRAEHVEGNVEGAWNVRWVRLEDGCQLDVERGNSTLSMPLNDPTQSELENAASQVAWIVEMVHPDAALPVDELDEVIPEVKPDEEVVETEPEVLEEVPETTEEPTNPVAEVVQPEIPVATTNDVGFAFSIIPDEDAASARIVPRFAINISGRYHGLSGLEVGLFNSELAFMHGVQLALGMNDVRGDVRGTQWAVGVNIAGDISAGVQLALGVNVASNSVVGTQLALGMNHAGGLMSGGQIALGINRAQSVYGGQLSVLNLSGDVTGFQTGIFNLAGDVGGAQLGIVNAAKRGGVQLGVLNISDTSDVALGLLSIMLDEPLYVTTWITSQGLLLGGIQHGSKYLKTMLFLGGAATGLEEGQVGAAGLGLSGHIPLFNRNYLEIDYLAMQLAAEDVRQQSHLSTVRVVWGYAFGGRFAVYGGPAISMLFSNREDGLNLAPDWVTASQASESDPRVWTWPEVHGGVRF